MACGVELCLEQPDRLLMVTKWLYPEVARRYGTNWRAVERDLRTVSEVIWREQHSRLEEIAGRPMEKRPNPAQLLAILVFRLENCGG